MECPERDPRLQKTVDGVKIITSKPTEFGKYLKEVTNDTESCSCSFFNAYYDTPFS